MAARSNSKPYGSTEDARGTRERKGQEWPHVHVHMHVLVCGVVGERIGAGELAGSITAGAVRE